MSMAHIICLGFSSGGTLIWNKEVNSFTDTSSCRDLTVSSRPYLCTEMSYASGRMAMRSAMASTMPMPSGLPMLKGRHDFKKSLLNIETIPSPESSSQMAIDAAVPDRPSCMSEEQRLSTHASIDALYFASVVCSHGRRSTCGKGLLTLSDAIVITDSPGATCLASA